MKNDEKVLKTNIKEMHFEKNLEERLLLNHIETLENLWNIKRKELKEKQFRDSEINQIQIKLQLNGIDFNKKVYTKGH